MICLKCNAVFYEPKVTSGQYQEYAGASYQTWYASECPKCGAAEQFLEYQEGELI